MDLESSLSFMISSSTFRPLTIFLYAIAVVTQNSLVKLFEKMRNSQRGVEIKIPKNCFLFLYPK